MSKYHLEFDSVTKSLSTIVEISFFVSKGIDTLWPPWHLSLKLLFKVCYSYFYACWIVYGEYFTLVDLLCVIFTSLRTFMFSLIKIHWKLLWSTKDLFFNFCTKKIWMRKKEWKSSTRWNCRSFVCNNMLQWCAIIVLPMPLLLFAPEWCLFLSFMLISRFHGTFLSLWTPIFSWMLCHTISSSHTSIAFCSCKKVVPLTSVSASEGEAKGSRFICLGVAIWDSEAEFQNWKLRFKGEVKGIKWTLESPS